MSSAAGHKQFDERDEELELLRRLVRDWEVEARDRSQRADRSNRERRSNSGGNPCEA